MATLEKITLSNDNEIVRATLRLRQFCREEYDYYDGLTKGDPNRIDPMDVLATLSVNSYITNVAQVRKIHRGMVVNCSEILPNIPLDSNLLTCPQATITELGSLLYAAVQTPGVLIPVATKILHRKRPNLIPMLDNVILAYYLNANPKNLPADTQDKRRAASVAMTVLELFREHLQSVIPQVEHIQKRLAPEGFLLTPVRIFEILLWTTIEECGYYRNV